jgi:hypothetical protein
MQSKTIFKTLLHEYEGFTFTITANLVADESIDIHARYKLTLKCEGEVLDVKHCSKQDLLRTIYALKYLAEISVQRLRNTYTQEYLDALTKLGFK